VARRSRYSTCIRGGLIAAAIVLSATPASGTAAEQHGAEPAATASGPVPVSDAGVRLGWRDPAPDARSPQRVELGWGLHHDNLPRGFNHWYGVYLHGLDRVAERNTIYGELAGNRRPMPAGGKAPAFCCSRMDTVAALERHPASAAAHRESPTLFVFGNVRKKKKRGLNVDFDDGWKLQAGSRKAEYSSIHRTRVGYLSVEREWERFHAGYSFQLERFSGWQVAPNHVLQFDYRYSAGDSIGIAFTAGRRVTHFGALGVQNAKVKGVTLRGQRALAETWALTFEAGYNDHDTLPSHAGIRMGVRHSF
jgi:YaiO family outer membrane protein